MTKISKVKKSTGAYVNDEGDMFATIGWNTENERYEARVYEYDGVNLDCISMFAHSSRLILAARPALELIGG